MITYASYLKRRTNTTGSGLVVGFTNSSFELLSAIGVFAALGFLAVAGGTAVETRSPSPGSAWPSWASRPSSPRLRPRPWSACCSSAGSPWPGLTSQISIMEVVISAVKDKTGWSRVKTVSLVGGLIAIISIVLIGGVSGVTILDVVDAFSNNIGIVGGALIAVVMVTWVYRRLDSLAAALNRFGSFKVGRIWKTLLGIVLPVVLTVLLVMDITDKITEGYGGFDTWVLVTFGWGSLAVVIVASIALSFIPWRGASALHQEDPDQDEAGKETV